MPCIYSKNIFIYNYIFYPLKDFKIYSLSSYSYVKLDCCLNTDSILFITKIINNLIMALYMYVGCSGPITITQLT